MPLEPIVFFDGVCGLCNWSVDFLIANDKLKKLKYSPLQGQAIKRIQPEFQSDDMNTIYVWTGSQLLEKSSAICWLLFQLGSGWKVLAFVLNLLPTRLLDFGYDFIASRRYQFFGVRETCRLPTPEEKKLFLD